MVHVVPEIVEQRLGRGENVWNLVLANMLVIAFALLIVLAQHAATISYRFLASKSQSIQAWRSLATSAGIPSGGNDG
jgi:hypothetical protein